MQKYFEWNIKTLGPLNEWINMTIEQGNKIDAIIPLEYDIDMSFGKYSGTNKLTKALILFTQ